MGSEFGFGSKSRLERVDIFLVIRHLLGGLLGQSSWWLPFGMMSHCRKKGEGTGVESCRVAFWIF